MDDLLAILVHESALDLLESEVNGKDVDWGGRRLDHMIEQLLSQQEKWALVFEPHYDQMDSVYHFTNWLMASLSLRRLWAIPAIA